MKTADQKQYWVYILLCENESYYTGYTDNLAKRYITHINQTGRCKYTRSFKPISIAQCWRIMDDKSLAMKIERYIKKLSREQKIKIILDPSIIATYEGVMLVSKKERLQFIQKALLAQ